MDFGEVLGKAWKIIWKNKVLWIFGILAGCGASGGSGGGGGSSNFSQGSSSMGQNPFGGRFPQAEQFFSQMERFFENIDAATVTLLIVGGVFLGLLLSVLVLALSSIGKAGLIYGASQADVASPAAEKMNFKQVWNGGKPYFWRIVLLSLLIGAASLVLVLLLMVPAILLGILTLGIGLLCILPLICILVPVFWVVNVLIEQATVAIVVEDLGVFDSIKRAWQVVVQQNLGSYIVLGLILMIGRAIVSFLIGLPALLILIPIVVGVVAGTQAALSGGLVTALVIFLIYLPIAILLSGILQAYVGSAWTLAFRRAVRPQPVLAKYDDETDLLTTDTPDSQG